MSKPTIKAINNADEKAPAFPLTPTEILFYNVNKKQSSDAFIFAVQDIYNTLQLTFLKDAESLKDLWNQYYDFLVHSDEVPPPKNLDTLRSEIIAGINKARNSDEIDAKLGCSFKKKIDDIIEVEKTKIGQLNESMLLEKMKSGDLGLLKRITPKPSWQQLAVAAESDEYEEQKEEKWSDKVTQTDHYFMVINDLQSSDEDFVTAVEVVFYNISQRFGIHLNPDYISNLVGKCEVFRKNMSAKVENKWLRLEIFQIIDQNPDLKKLINDIISKEKSAEVLGCKIDGQLETRMRETVMSFDPSTNIFSLKYRNLLPGNNFFNILNNNPEIIDKPIRGVFQAAIIQLFLMSPLKISNMRICDKGDHFLVGNVNFDHCFTMQNASHLQQRPTPEYLLDILTRRKEEFIDHDLARTIIFNGADSSQRQEAKKEIEQTIKNIANLRDEDLQGFVDEMAQIKDQNGKALIPEDGIKKYLQILKDSREFFRQMKNEKGELIFTAETKAAGTLQNSKPKQLQVGESLPLPPPLPSASTTSSASSADTGTDVEEKEPVFKSMRPQSQSLQKIKEANENRYQERLATRAASTPPVPAPQPSGQVNPAQADPLVIRVQTTTLPS